MRSLYILLVLSIGFTRSGGWPANYPTKTLEEWEGVLAKFTPWVFRAAESDMDQPFYPGNK